MIKSTVFGVIKLFLPLFALAIIAACSKTTLAPDPITLGGGWYHLERSENGDSWWVWTKKQGEIIVNSNKDVTLTLRGGVGSIQRPNKVEVSVNGKTVTQWEITGDKYEQKPFQPLPVALVNGSNIIKFTSQNDAIKIPTDIRELAIAVDNLTLTDPKGRVEYSIQK
jgi:hypothetical protein